MVDGVVDLDGRVVGFASYGPTAGSPVIWCHGGPGSRLEPAAFEPFLDDLGLRVVGIDRPGYGNSTPRPGRTIVDWVPDCLAVADHLGLTRFTLVGVSTGGAYAFATAALASDRVQGVLACCAMSDMRHEPSRAVMDPVACHEVWNAPNRETAVEVAHAALGGNGEAFFDPSSERLSEPDRAFVAEMTSQPGFESGLQAMFANGVQGYVDDRLADGPGWVSFDVRSVSCPVTILHGAEDIVVDPVNARHTHELIGHSTLVIEPGHGHMSVIATCVGPLLELAAP
jgi:pimeloyl-ACP methyl ester carboxylesterase